ncbi:hypothetical protein HC928_04520 [bacterium]|nr:hypothetical protein [bacterium]
MIQKVGQVAKLEKQVRRKEMSTDELMRRFENGDEMTEEEVKELAKSEPSVWRIWQATEAENEVFKSEEPSALACSKAKGWAKFLNW